MDALNIFAYDVTTGNRVASFNHSLNAQGLAIAKSPDGSRVYVGGDFSTVDGMPAATWRVFDTQTTRCVPWNGNVGGQVRALACRVPPSTSVAASRRRWPGRAALAAFAAPAPQPVDDLGPIAGGVQRHRAGHGPVARQQPRHPRRLLRDPVRRAAYGMGSVDAATGAVLPWAANTKIRTAGYNGGITSLSTDGTQVFGTGYAFGSGASFEGTFAAEPRDRRPQLGQRLPG